MKPDHELNSASRWPCTVEGWSVRVARRSERAPCPVNHKRASHSQATRQVWKRRENDSLPFWAQLETRAPPKERAVVIVLAYLYYLGRLVWQSADVTASPHGCDCVLSQQCAQNDWHVAGWPARPVGRTEPLVIKRSKAATFDGPSVSVLHSGWRRCCRQSQPRAGLSLPDQGGVSSSSQGCTETQGCQFSQLVSLHVTCDCDWWWRQQQDWTFTPVTWFLDASVKESSTCSDCTTAHLWHSSC